MFSLAAKAKANGDKRGFETASTYVAFNQIVDYFNSVHFPAEHAALTAERAPAKINLSDL
ncbi:MAG: hypothetical protein LBN30_00015 [Oscillospiraceae bacterium]|nr:hypothetical protein [Oscillospiraceae bacterium]